MKRLLSFFLAGCLLLGLTACGKKQPQTTSAPTETTAAPTETTAATTVPPTEDKALEPDVLYRNPLTGEPMDHRFTARPYAVTINNIVYAMPQCGTSQADILYEILAEGGITRCLAVFDDLSKVEHIGSIRSARTYLIDLALGVDAIYIHHGFSEYALAELQNLDVDDLCPLRGKGSAAYYRDSYRLSAGYDLEHTSFAEGKDLVQESVNLGYAQERPEGEDFGWRFVEDGTPADGADALEIVVNFHENGKTTTLTYDEASGTYKAAQYGDALIDGNTNDTLSFRNVLIMKAYSYTDSEGYRQFVEMTDTSGDGYFACGGKLIPIHWSRGHVDEPFVYTKTDGTLLSLGVGKSYVAVVPLDGEPDYQ